MIRKMLFIASIASVLLLAACSGVSGNPETGEIAANHTQVKVMFWHSMGGEPGKAIDKMVADFNQRRDDIFVEAVYQGSYDESLNKLRASLGTNDGPTIVQVYEIGSRFMIDSQMIQPIQKFIDAEKYDLTQLEENILNYYTFDGELYSMPFNSSNPILYYNKDMFEEAGLDPELPPRTYEEVESYARILHIHILAKHLGDYSNLRRWTDEQTRMDHRAV